ncbi:MAG: hypothetical protein P8Z35_00255 [Ignavibacteriaceae bacterium]|jgi:hypothetical protein
MRTILFFLSISILFLFGCSNNNGNPASAGGVGGIGVAGGGNTGGNGTGGGAVTFTIDVVHNQQNVNYFQFTPSTGVTLTMVTGNCPAANVNNQQVQGDGTTLYTNNDPFYIPLTGINVQSGQQWTFTITGKIGSSTGQDYTSNARYTIP